MRQTPQSNKTKEIKRSKPESLTKIVRIAKRYWKLALVVVVIAVAIIAISVIKNNAEIVAEENRDYFINVDDKISKQCSLEYNDGSKQFSCGKITFDGTFSSYDTVELRKGDHDLYLDITTSGNDFSISHKIYPSVFNYRSDYFSADKLEKSIDVDVEIKIHNTILKRDVLSKKVTISYSLTSEQAEQIKAKREEYLKEQSEEESKKKSEEERKAKEEADKKAEEEAKKAEEKSKSESSSGSSSQSDGESLPDDIDPYDIKALCERTLKSVGYSNSISVTNHYAMGYPPYIYVIVGTLKGKDTVQCQANWSSWTVKSLTINGQKVYGE